MNPIYECIAQTLDASQARVVIIFSQAMYVLLCFRKPIVCAMHSYISFMNMSKNDEGIARKMDRQTRRQDAFVIHVLRIVIILITRLVLIVHLCITY